MFIIDRAVTHSYHAFVFIHMSYLRSIQFPVICMFAFYCFHLRSAKKVQNLLISVLQGLPIAQGYSLQFSKALKDKNNLFVTQQSNLFKYAVEHYAENGWNDYYLVLKLCLVVFLAQAIRELKDDPVALAIVKTVGEKLQRKQSSFLSPILF